MTAKTLQEVESSILYEVHCHECGAKLGYYLECPDDYGYEVSRMEVTCLRCVLK